MITSKEIGCYTILSLMALVFICVVCVQSSKPGGIADVWAVDPVATKIHRLYEWAYPHGIIVFKSDQTLDLPDLWWNWDFDYPGDTIFEKVNDDTTRMAAIKITKDKKKWKKRGRWRIINLQKDSIEINAPFHPLSGKYYFRLWKEKTRRGIYNKMSLSNDSTYIECFVYKTK